MRWILKDITGVEVASPARESTDLEGGIVKDRVRNIKERQTALMDFARAIRGYRKLADQPLTLRGSECADFPILETAVCSSHPPWPISS